MFVLIIYWIFLFGTLLGRVLGFAVTKIRGDEFMNIDAGKLMAIDEMVQDGFGGKIQGHKLFFSGVCPACIKKENKSKISVDNNDKR